MASVVSDLVTESAIDRTDVAVCVAAVAGLDFADDAAAFEGALALEFPSARISALNDAAAMLSVHDAHEFALVVVCGAGLNAVGRGPRGTASVPALDWVSGDWGGGDAIGREAVRVAYRSADGRGPDTSLREAVLEATSSADHASLARDIRDGVVTRKRISALAEVVAREANRGDEVASGVMDRAIEEAVALAGEVTSRAWGDVPVAPGTPALLVGGLFRDESFAQSVAAHLDEAGFDAERFPDDAIAGVIRDACAVGELHAAVAGRVLDGLRNGERA